MQGLTRHLTGTGSAGLSHGMARFACMVAAGLGMSLAGCSDGSSHGGEVLAPVAPPSPVVAATLILASREAGDNILGQLHELPLNASDPAGNSSRSPSSRACSRSGGVIRA